MGFYIAENLKTLGIPFEFDAFGNIIATKGSVDRESGQYFPAVACHLDTVHEIQDKYEVFSYQEEGADGDTIYSSPTGIGGDDKNGIAVVLWLLGHKDIPNLKAFFFQREEKGCEGSEFIDHKYFDEVGYVIEPDRRGSTDLITSFSSTQRTLCSDGFREVVAGIASAHGYKETSGSITDVVQLAQDRIGISVMNLSCGYHEPHRKTETVSLQQVLIAGHIVRESILALGEYSYPHIMPAPKYHSKPGGYWHNGVWSAFNSEPREVKTPKENSKKGKKSSKKEDPPFLEVIGDIGTAIVGDEIINVPSLGGHFWIQYLDADEPDVLQVIDMEDNEDVTTQVDIQTVDEILELLFIQGELEHANPEYFFPGWDKTRGINIAKDDYYNWEDADWELKGI